MDREIAKEVRTRRTARRVLIVLIAVAAVVFSFAATIAWLRPSVKRRDLRTARVERGPVEATLQASGTVVPRVEQVVSSPVEARVLRIDRRAGDAVQAGDALVTLDTAGARLDTERLQQTLSQKESDLAQLRLRLDEIIASTQAQIEQKRLDATILQYTSQQKSRLGEAGLASQQEVLAAAASAKKSEIEIRQLEEALARARRSREAQLAAAANAVGIARRERDESQRQLVLAMMRADRSGVVTWVVPEVGATVRRGDILARIADLTAYRVNATISDIHAAKLSAGMRARVKLDDTTSVGGTIDSVDPRIVNGVVTFSVTLDEPAQPRLRNNLRVDVYVVTARRGNALRVARGALGQSDVEDVFIVRGDRAVRTRLRYGLTGDEQLEVVSGAAEGDELVISNMNDYAGIRELRLN
ncbi:MAG TPA: HlyD family efflux transporter periplasmic adaptor subunit [Thermoanaerobaculia bacterium]|jgi:HlyD family secretion protein